MECNIPNVYSLKRLLRFMFPIAVHSFQCYFLCFSSILFPTHVSKLDIHREGKYFSGNTFLSFILVLFSFKKIFVYIQTNMIRTLKRILVWLWDWFAPITIPTCGSSIRLENYWTITRLVLTFWFWFITWLSRWSSSLFFYTSKFRLWWQLFFMSTFTLAFYFWFRTCFSTCRTWIFS